MLLVQKWPFFQVFFLGILGKENVFYDVLEQTKTFQAYKNEKFKNLIFLQRVNRCFWSKNGHLSNIFFLGNVGQENVFYDILEPKNAFLGYKNTNFKKSNN